MKKEIITYKPKKENVIKLEAFLKKINKTKESNKTT
jgi:hypothetical protein